MCRARQGKAVRKRQGRAGRERGVQGEVEPPQSQHGQSCVRAWGGSHPWGGGGRIERQQEQHGQPGGKPITKLFRMCGSCTHCQLKTCLSN